MLPHPKISDEMVGKLRGKFSVLRHGWRRDSYWRVIYSGEESRARQHFEKEGKSLRQGRLMLLGPQVECIDSRFGPALTQQW